MDPFTLEATVDRPRAVVFDYLADVANHPEFTDHFLKDWHMTREETYGVGAGGRFEADLPFARFAWGDYTLVEAYEGRHLVFAGRAGKFNRIRTVNVFELRDGPGGATRVALTVETRPELPTDRLLESLGQKRSLRRSWKKALKRLGLILEDDRARGRRATIAGGPRKPATDH